MTPQERFDRNTWLMKVAATAAMSACLVGQYTRIVQAVVHQADGLDRLMWGAMVSTALLVVCLQLPIKRGSS